MRPQEKPIRLGRLQCPPSQSVCRPTTQLASRRAPLLSSAVVVRSDSDHGLSCVNSALTWKATAVNMHTTASCSRRYTDRLRRRILNPYLLLRLRISLSTAVLHLDGGRRVEARKGVCKSQEDDGTRTCRARHEQPREPPQLQSQPFCVSVLTVLTTFHLER